MDTLTNASLTDICTIKLVMEDTAWTVLRTVMGLTANGARKTSICERMAIASTVLVIQQALGHFSAMLRDGASASPESPETNVTAVKPTTTTSDHMDVSIVDANQKDL